VLGATLGLPAGAPSPFGNASCHINDDLVISVQNQHISTYCNPIPFDFSIRHSEKLSMLSQPHLIYRLRRLNAHRLPAGAHETRYRQRPKEARTIRTKEATSRWTYDSNPKIVFYIYGPAPAFGCMHPPTVRSW
jgi:hypothetical protein